MDSLIYFALLIAFRTRHWARGSGWGHGRNKPGPQSHRDCHPVAKTQEREALGRMKDTVNKIGEAAEMGAG